MLHIIPGCTLDKSLYNSSNSIIYRALRNSDQLPVIVKILNKEFPGQKEIIRFKREFEITNSLQLDGVIKVYHLVEHKNTLAIIMEDFDAQSLNNIIYNRKLNFIELLNIAVKITATLGEIHKQHIIHKDINPANIVWNHKSNKIKIIDFGISTTLSRETQEILNPNVLEGTLAYISPEQTGRMNRTIDFRSDLYSLGATLYEIFSRQLPFQSQDVMELVHGHIARTPPFINEINRQIPQVLNDIIMKLMAKKAEDRYQSAYGLQKDLELCLDKLSNNHSIDYFPLGQQELLDQFRIPEKLYGRDQETHTLLSAFDRICQGTNEIVIVAGYAGIGKSSLVMEIHKPIVEKRGYFISGKFEQYKTNIPYFALIQAFKEMVHQLLTESSKEIHYWKKRLLDSLGQNAQVIIDVLPELELIIDRQPDLPDLGPVETLNRLNLTFQRFLQSLCSENHPLVLFIDDLQWADSDSLDLIQVLLSDSDCQYLLLIGAYRDNEIDDAHPLISTLNQIREQNNKTQLHTNFNHIFLDHLSSTHIKQLLADCFSLSNPYTQDISTVPDKDIDALADLISKKTFGNPFFINQFLQYLYEHKLINFHYPTKKWVWDIKQLENANFTDNVLDFMCHIILQLPKQTRHFLQLAACIGVEFDLLTLAMIYNQPDKLSARDLIMLFSTDLVKPIGDSYKYILNEDTIDLSPVPARERKSTDSLLNIRAKFIHDRIQQAAYSLISEQEKIKHHHKIGRLMLARMTAEEIDEHIFDIVSHINFALDLIHDQREKYDLARLNLKAGKKAKASASFEAARKFFFIAMDLLDENGWNQDYDLTLTIYLQSAETAYLCGLYSETNKLAGVIKEKAKTFLDQLQMDEILIQSLLKQNRLPETIDKTLDVLKQAGLVFPKRTTKLNFLIAFLKTKFYLGGKTIEDLMVLPPMTDPFQLTIQRIIAHGNIAIFMNKPELTPLLIFNNLIRSVQYGNSSYSTLTYVSYGFILSDIMKQAKSGYEFGELSLSLVNQLEYKKHAAQVLLLFNHRIKSWQYPFKDSLEDFFKGYRLGLEHGDFEYASLCFMTYILFLLYEGDELNKIRDQINRHFNSLNKMNYAPALCIIKNKIDLLSQLMDSSAKITLNQKQTSENELLTQLTQINNRIFILDFYSSKLMISYIFNRYQQAIEHIRQAEKYLYIFFAAHVSDFFFFFYSLCILALYDQFDKKSQKQYLNKIITQQKKFKKKSQIIPANYLHKYYLVEAELARVLGKNAKARDYYDKAIKIAQQYENIQVEALANELAAKFYLANDNDKIAQLYMIEARYAYVKWGALAKVQALDNQYPKLLSLIKTHKKVDLTTTDTSIAADDNISQVLDLSTVIKSYRAISGEIILENLLKTMMAIVIENAGSQKGFLIMSSNLRRQNLNHFSNKSLPSSNNIDFQDLEIVVEGYTDQNISIVQRFVPVVDSGKVCTAVIQYTARTKTSLIIHDAVQEKQFAHDDYIKNNRPKSILCIPVLHHGELTAVLYLENNLTTGAFTQYRIDILNLLCSQLAISIENARLYQQLENYSHTLEEKVEQRTAELSESEERFRELSEATFEGVLLITDELILDANQALLTMFQYSQEEITGKNTRDLIINESRHSIFPEILAHDNKPYKALGFRKNHSHFPVEILSKNAHYKGNNIHILAIRDISERERIERLRQDTERIVKHDLKNPLAAIIHISDHILKKHQHTLNPKLSSMLTIINQNGYNINHMIDQSLDLFKMEEGSYILHKDQFNLISLIEDLNHEFNSLSELKSIHIEVYVNQNPLNQQNSYPISGAYYHLKSLFANLIKNAIEASPEQNTVQIFITDDSQFYLIDIHNQGVIPASIKDRFFDKYSTYNKKHGTGLGTYSALLIARTHGGDISFTTSESEGTHLLVQLPIHD